jgi:hypothetical protein
MRRALILVLLLTTPLLAQKKPKEKYGYDLAARAVILHDAIVYVTADDSAQKVDEVTLGHEVIISLRNGAWVQVFANTDTPDQDDPDHAPEFATDAEPNPATGWIKDKGLVNSQTPNGDAILFGAAANMEEAASEPHAPKGAAQSAHLLYRRVYEYFPASPLAAEAFFRSADIRWQLQKQANSDLPSAHEQESYLRPQLYEGEMNKIIKLYPGSSAAARAAYDKIDNKVCGDWQGLPKCPEQETTYYLKYASDWPDSPLAPQAMYNAIYRQGVVVSMYLVDGEQKRSQFAAEKVAKLTGEMRTKYPQSDYTRRAESIAFRVKQGIAIYGTDRD